MWGEVLEVFEVVAVFTFFVGAVMVAGVFIYVVYWATGIVLEWVEGKVRK